MIIPAILARASLRPDNYFFGHYYDCFVAMIYGCDYCCNGQLLEGFSEWLRLEGKGSDYSGYPWSKIVLLLDYHQMRKYSPVWPKSEEENRNAVKILMDRLVYFHDHQSSASDMCQST